MRSGYVGVFLLVLTLGLSGSVMAWEPPRPPVELTGVSQFVGWAAKTGVMVSPPDVNLCQITEARLTYGRGFLAKLHTREECADGYVLKEMNWDVVLDRNGKLAMKLPKFFTMTFAGESPMTVESLPMIQDHIGCPLPLQGTMPIYYGHFDGTFFHANAEFQGICDGGSMWGPLFGVSEKLGPLHVDFLISLEVNK